MELQTRKHVQFISLALFVMVGSVVCVSAQGYGYKPSKDDPHYKLGELGFQYPARYSPRSVKGDEGKTVFFVSEREKESLFVSLSSTPAEMKKEVEQLREKLLAELLPGEGSKFTWKKVASSPDKAGKYDVKQEKWQAFDGKKRFFFEYHYLKLKNKDIIAGYAFIMEGEPPAMAASLFNQGLDAGSGPAGEGSSKIIASITGESDISVGMPPPGVGPPRSKN